MRRPEVEPAEQTATPPRAGQSVRRWDAWLPKAYLGLLVLGLAWLLVFPQIAVAYQISLAITVMLVVVLAVSWNLISGYTGYVSFGHAGFFGIGSYIGTLLVVHEIVPWWGAVVLAGLGTTLVALLIGYPTLRLRGPYFAVTMLGLSEVARIVATTWESLTGGGLGLLYPVTTDANPYRSDFYAMGALTVVVIVVSYFVATSDFGLKLISIREDEVAAQALGTNTTAYKMAAFALSSFFPGAAGAIYARHVGYIDPLSVFAVIWSIRAISTAMFGGQGTILGPIIGAVGLTLVSERVWANYPFLYPVIFGGLIALVVLFMPGGVMRLLARLGWIPRSRRL